MAWDNSRRVVPGDWQTRKARCLTEHEHRCHACGHQGAEEVDHLLNVARGGNHEPDNLAPIHGRPCPTCGQRCHTIKTTAESAAGRNRHRRQPERHPGLL